MTEHGPTQREWEQNNDFDDLGELDDYVERPVKPKKILKLNRPILLLAQMAVCGAVLIGAFALKMIGGNLYAQVHDWFFANYDNSIFTDGKINLDFFQGETKKETESKSESQTESKTKIKAVLPLKACTVTSPYGERNNDDGTSTFHKGVDLAAALDEPIYAITDGTVITAENNTSYGNYVVIQSDKREFLYAHCSELCVEIGAKVHAGDTIAKAGDTGEADGVHLHLEIKENGEYINPSIFLDNITA
ncbi:MAG: M23 family metallopeptidase [Acutalibacteraceae bacterium]